MKLSEAMQLGAMLKPQVYGPFVNRKGTCTCAMGGALDAVGQLCLIKGKRNTQINEKRIRKIWPWLNWCLKISGCPWCGSNRAGKGFENIYYLIVHLNDKDHLTRQKIAGLIMDIEAQALRQIQLLPPSVAEPELAQLEANLNAVRKRKVQSHRVAQHSRNETERLSPEAGRRRSLVPSP